MNIFLTFFNPVLHRPLRGHTNLRNHRKLAIVDSANTDMRSLLLSYEVGVLVTSQVEVAQVSDWLETLMQGCEEGVENVGAMADMGEGLARLLAPQL